MRGFFSNPNDGRGEYSPLSQVVVESVSNNDALFPSDLLDVFKKIILDYDVDSLERLNAWHREAPELVARFKAPIDQFVTPYLENHPNVKSLVKDSERKQSQEEDTLEALVNTALEKSENSPAASLSQEIQFLQSILNRASLDELSEIKSELADTQDLIALYNKPEFFNYIDFIDSLILKRLVQKTLENAHFIDEKKAAPRHEAEKKKGDNNITALIDLQVQETDESLTQLIGEDDHAVPKVFFCLIALVLCSAVSAGLGAFLIGDGDRRENSTEKDWGYGLLVGPAVLGFSALIARLVSSCQTAWRIGQARDRNRFFVAASEAVQTLEQKPEEQKSPRNG